MKRILTIMLILCTVIACFTACGESKTTAETTAKQDSAEPTLSETLGFGEENNKDITFNILVNNENEHFDMASDFVGSSSGNVVEAATYNRTIACNDYLGIEINYVPQAGAYNSGVVEKLEQSAFSGTAEYDMIAIGLNTGIMSARIDLFQNVLEMNTVNTEHDWWVQDVIEEVSMNGQLYFLSGDIAISTYGYLGCIFANLQVDKNYSLNTDYFTMVKDGDWTLEKFFTLYKDVGTGDDAYNSETKQGKLGWANVSTGTRVMWSSCGISLFERDETTEKISLKTTLDETTVNFMTKLKTEYEKENTYYFGDAEKSTADELFQNDRALFYSYYVFKAKEFNDSGMQSDFAILPLPKLDDNQKEYISTNVSAYNAVFFLKNVKSLSLSGKVAEYMGWYGKTEIVPAYYDSYLKFRATHKSENTEMLDLIRDNLRISANELFGTIENVIGRTVLSPNNVVGTANYTPVYTQPAQWRAMNVKASAAIEKYVMLFYGQE